MNDIRIAIILGTGMKDALTITNERIVAKPCGTIEISTGILCGVPIYFTLRHNEDGVPPPHEINHAARFLWLKEQGVQYCLSTAAVGSLRKDWQPGVCSILSDFIQMSKAQNYTLLHAPPYHTDFSEPFSSKLRSLLLNASKECNSAIEPRGIYVCTDGPRYETPAEINAFRIIGGDVVGMTVAHEAICARELNMHYASIAAVANMGTGLTSKPLDNEDVKKTMRELVGKKIAQLFEYSVLNLREDT